MLAKVLLSGENPGPMEGYPFESTRVTRGGVIAGRVESMIAVVITTNSNKLAATSLYS